MAIAPIAGAAITLLAGSSGIATICASDATARKLDAFQVELHQGPCWQAMAEQGAVLAPHVQAENHPEWPLFADAITSDPGCAGVSALFAFPLTVGSISIGAVDLYSRQPMELARGELIGIRLALKNLVWEILQRVLTHPTITAGPGDRPSWSDLDRAVRLIAENLDVGLADSAMLLRVNAYATGQSVTEVAADVVRGRITFEENALRRP